MPAERRRPLRQPPQRGDGPRGTLYRVPRPCGGWSIESLGVTLQPLQALDGVHGVGVVPTAGREALLPEGRLYAVGAARTDRVGDVAAAFAELQLTGDAVTFDVRALVKAYYVDITVGDLGIECSAEAIDGLSGAWVRVSGVADGSAADAAGLPPDHYVTAVDGAAVRSAADIARAVDAAWAAGATTARFDLELRPWELWEHGGGGWPAPGGAGRAAEAGGRGAPRRAAPALLLSLTRSFGRTISQRLHRKRSSDPSLSSLELILPPPLETPAAEERDHVGSSPCSGWAVGSAAARLFADSPPGTPLSPLRRVPISPFGA